MILDIAEEAGGTDRRPRLSARHREWVAGYLFVLPDVVGLSIFVGAPMVLSLLVGFFDLDGFGGYRFVGLGNYREMAGDPHFWSAIRVTAAYTAMLVPTLYLAGLGLALLVQRGGAFNGAMRALFFLPQIVSLVVAALVWQLMFVEKIGVLSRAAALLGIGSVSFLGDPDVALVAIVAVSVWFLMGFHMLIFLGGLQDIPRDIYEAARLDGAGRIARFRHITLPLLKPTSFFVLIVSLVAAVAGSQAFDLIYVMTRGGPANSTTVIIQYIYQQGFQFGRLGYAASMSAVLVVILLLVTTVFFRLTHGGRFDHAKP